MPMATFHCPGCKQTVDAGLNPTGKYPYPPHYVCPNCDQDEQPAPAHPEQPPPDSRRSQRQLALMDDPNREEKC